MAGDEEFDPEMFPWFRFQSWPALKTPRLPAIADRINNFLGMVALLWGQVLNREIPGICPASEPDLHKRECLN